jgi:hypothetical protein
VWRKYYRAAKRYSTQFGGNFLLISYEQLLSDPRTVLTRCCELVGTTFDEKMLAFHEVDNRNFDPQRERWKRKAATPLDPANAEAWRTQLPTADIAVIERITGNLMAAAGYVRSGERISLSDARSRGKTWLVDGARTIRLNRRRRHSWGQRRSENRRLEAQIRKRAREVPAIRDPVELAAGR